MCKMKIQAFLPLPVNIYIHSHNEVFDALGMNCLYNLKLLKKRLGQNGAQLYKQESMNKGLQ